jgi:hypothetical protein
VPLVPGLDCKLWALLTTKPGWFNPVVLAPVQVGLTEKFPSAKSSAKKVWAPRGWASNQRTKKDQKQRIGQQLW